MLALIMVPAVVLRADTSATALHISRPVADSEGLTTFLLSWNASSNATYLVQSATDLRAAAAWKTVEVVTPTGSVGQASIRLTHSDQFVPQGIGARATYYRLILPQPQIFSVEPALVAPGEPVDFHVLGQCFPTNAELHINSLPVNGTLYQTSDRLVQPAFTPGAPGNYVFDLVVSGQVVSSFTVVCADALASPELVLQGPPNMEPPASPSAVWLSKKGYDYYQAQSQLNSAALHNNPAFQQNQAEGQMPDSPSQGFLSKRGYDYYKARSDLAAAGLQNNPYFQASFGEEPMPQALLALWLSKKGYDYYQAAGARSSGVQEGKKGLNAVNVKLARMIGGGDDDDDGDPLASLLMPALMKAKEKANRTKCVNNLRPSGISPFSGDVQLCAVDMVIPGRGLDFVWARTYHSRLGRLDDSANGWTFSYDLDLQPLGGDLVIHDGTGRADTFKLQTNGTYTCPEFFRTGTLSNDVFTLTFADGGSWEFNPLGTSPEAGKLASIKNGNGDKIKLFRDTAGRLAQIVDDLDRTNTVAYDTSGRLVGVTDFSGRTVRYEYDGHGDLVACVSPPVVGTPNGNDFPGGKTNRYTYTSGYPLALNRQNHLLLACVDALGQTNAQFSYDLNAASPSYLRCSAVQEHANPPTQLRFFPRLPTHLNGYATVSCLVNDPVGNVTENHFDARGRCVMEREYTGRATPGVPVTNALTQLSGKLRPTDPDFYETQWTWNNDSLCRRVLVVGGQETQFVYQSDFDPATPARKRADCRVVRELASEPVDFNGDGVADAGERVWRFEYDPRFGSPAPQAGEIKIRHKGWDGLIYHRSAATDPRFGSDPTAFRLRSGVIAEVGAGRPATVGRVKHKGWDGLIYHRSAFCTTATDPRGNVTTAQYDVSGNCIEVARNNLQLGALAVEDCVYDSHGQLTAITNAPDANGRRRVDTFAYSQGQLTECVIDAGAGGLALTSAFEYDERGNLTRCVDPRTNDWLYTYNALDQCVRARSPRKPQPNITRCATDFAYDANDNLVACATELRDAADNLVGTNILRASYNYLAKEIEYARIRHAAFGQAITNRFVYDANGQCVQVLGPDAVAGTDQHQAVTFQYDERGLLFRTISAPGSGLDRTNEFSYTPQGEFKELFEKINAPIKKKSITYDGFNRPSSSTDPMGNVTTFNYDAGDNLKVVRHFGETNDVPGSAGNLRLAETRCDYDGLNRIYKVHALHFGRTQSPVGDGEATTTFAYAPNGACTSMTDDLGCVTTYAYDTVGWLAAVSSSTTGDRIFVKNKAGRVISVTQTDLPSLGGPPQVFTCTYAYDELNRVVSATDSAGNTSSCAYDSLGDVVRTTDALGNDTVYTYAFMNKLRSLINYAGSSSAPAPVVVASHSVTYDSSLRCASATDANGNVTSYAYDTRGNCTLVAHADGTQQQLVWSPRSNLIQTTDANGTVCVNTYDLNDRLIQRAITMGGGGAGGANFTETFTFDGCDRLTSHHDDDCDGDFVYDSLGRCVRETLNGLATVSTYDALGNRLSLTYPGGRVLTYAYDTSSRCTAISESGAPLASFDYAGSDRVSRITYGNGTRTLIGYNGLVSPPNAQGDYGFGQISQVRHQLTAGSTLFSACKVTWDQKQNKGARTTAIPGAGGRTNDMLFAYDALDQLTQSAVLEGSTLLRNTAYGFDRMGNRTNVTGAAFCSGNYLMESASPPADFPMNQYTATPCDTRTYDANGNLTSRVGGAGALTYQFDYADRLTAVLSVVDDGTGGTAVTPVASYTYDALGRRVSKTVTSGTLGTTTRQYCYDGACVIEERENSAVAGSFVHATGLMDQVRENDTVVFEMRLGTRDYYVHTDDQGNALALTTTGGTVAERYDYDDYGAVTFLTSDGVPTSDTSSAVGNPYCWGGLRLDAETGLHTDDGGGYFEPQTGRAVRGKVKSVRDMGNGFNPSSDDPACSIQPRLYLKSKFNNGVIPNQDKSNNPWSGGGGSGAEMKNGTVKFFNEAKGFGFATGGGGGGINPWSSGVSRIKFRELSLAGRIPGARKASW